jgi:hypothetical protein
MIDNKQGSRGQQITLALLFIFYCFVSIRYFPGEPGKTIMATAQHLLSVLPFTVGFTLVLMKIFDRAVGVRMSKSNFLRIFLLLSLLLELFYGIYNYLALSQNMPPL